MISDYLRWIRRCPSCGDSFLPVDWLCRSCLINILNKTSLKHRYINPNIDHYYLIEWKKGDGLTSIVHSLKGGRCEWAFEYLSQYFSHFAHETFPIYFPSKGPKDHAFQWAYSLAKRTGAEMRPIQKKTQFKQSLSGRQGRKSVLFYPQVSSNRYVVLADDIVTTGATATACYQALGRPRNMTVWSLFYRKDLRF